MEPKYTMTWRAAGTADGATTIEEMAEAFRETAKELDDMSAAGVELIDDGGQEDDRFTLSTTNPEVAHQYGMTMDDGTRRTTKRTVVVTD